MQVYKRKTFQQWQRHAQLPDSALCQAATELESGLIDADLGGRLYKKRVARPGGGKSAGYRLILSARIGNRYIFLFGFSKNDRTNIARDEIRALQYAGKVLLDLDHEALFQALNVGVLIKVNCDEQTH